MALIRMSDGMLDTSIDAVLSRISKLEAAVATGTFVSSAVAVESAEKQVEKPIAEEKEAVREEQVQKVISQETAESSLKMMRGWNEVAEKAAAGDMSVLPFLKMARAFCDGNDRIYIRFPNDFAKDMVEKKNVKNGIVAALCVQLKRAVPPESVAFEILVGDEDISDLDEFDM